MTFQSALIIAVPEAEPLVQWGRDQADWSAPQGVPAHITLLYPFLPPHHITPQTHAELRDFFAPFAAFDFALIEPRRFPNVLYLAPAPDDQFLTLMYALFARYPETPPYGGAFTEVHPHLTIVELEDVARVDDLEREFRRQHGAQLPRPARAREVQLIDNTSGRWAVQQTFPLAAAPR